MEVNEDILANKISTCEQYLTMSFAEVDSSYEAIITISDCEVLLLLGRQNA